MTDLGLAVDEEMLADVGRHVSLLGRAGTWFTGEERVAIAAVARAARAGETISTVLPDATARAASAVSADPGGITAELIDDFEANGLSRISYVELIGTVSRLAAVDAFTYALGKPDVALPEPEAGRPSLSRAPGLLRNGSWVPTGGKAGAASALSAVAAQDAAQANLHSILYLSYRSMGDFAYAEALTRTQMELIAARVSYLNECFYCLLSHAWLLRASAQHTNALVELRGLTDPSIDTKVPAAAELMRFADAIVDRNDGRLAASRDALVDKLGEEAAVAAAGVAANFEMMNRVLDAAGVDVPESAWTLAPDLGFEVA